MANEQTLCWAREYAQPDNAWLVVKGIQHPMLLFLLHIRISKLLLVTSPSETRSAQKKERGGHMLK